jgi:DNA-binding transcriptional ArsR family regulator
MAHSKADHYEKEFQLISELLKAISYPGRQKIIKKLRFEGTLTVKQLRQTHPISGPAFTGHLKILIKVRFVEWKEEFPYTYYSLDLERLREAKKLVYEFFESLEL